MLQRQIVSIVQRETYQLATDGDVVSGMPAGRVCEHYLQMNYPTDAEAYLAAKKRFKGLAKLPTNKNAYEVVSSEDFHLALINCAVEVVAMVQAKVSSAACRALRICDAHLSWSQYLLLAS